MDLFEDAHSLATQVASGALKAADLMDATYDQIERVNGPVNALVSLLPRSEAVQRAHAADAAGQGGPLHGLPLAVKDLVNAEGIPTSMGSPIFSHRGAMPTDDVMVARMRAAGAIVIGKSNVPQFGLGSHSVNPVHGATRNPWDLSRTAGGSSGGAAVALATGMVALADGSDMMGSLRNPAGWTNTYGLRPSWGVVPSEPLGDTFLHQLATLGPMGRSPADVEMLLRVQAGPDRRQPHWQPLGQRVAPARLGWLGDWGGAYAMEAGVLSHCEHALLLFEALGCSIEPVAPPMPAGDLWDAWTVLRSWQVATSLAPVMAGPAARAQLPVQALWEAERGLSYSAMDVHKASVLRSKWFAAAAKMFERFDAVVMPTAQMWPFDVTIDWPHEIAGRAMDSYHRWMEVVVPASLAGLPALSVPAGFGVQGLPMGLQIIGPRGNDLGLLSLGQRWHEAADWTLRRPACAS